MNNRKTRKEISVTNRRLWENQYRRRVIPFIYKQKCKWSVLTFVFLWVATTLPNKLLFYEIYTLKVSSTTSIFTFLLMSYFIRYLTGKTCFVLITSGISTRNSAEVYAETELGDFFFYLPGFYCTLQKTRKWGVNVNKLTILSFAIQNVRVISKFSLSITIKSNYTIRGHNLWAVPEHRKWLEITELTVFLTVTKHKKHNFKNNSLSH